MSYTLIDEDRKHYHIFHIGGKFDIANVQEIQKAVDCVVKMGQKVLLFELSKSTFVDSSAIGLLANLHKDLMSKGGKVCLAALSPVASKTFHAFKAERVFEIFKSIQDADVVLDSGLSVEERGFYALIKLPRKFNVNTVQPLREAIDGIVNNGHTHVVFDFEQTEFITSIGIGILTNLQRNLKGKDGHVYLIGIPPSIRSLLETTNVLKVLTEYKSIEEIEDKLI